MAKFPSLNGRDPAWVAELVADEAQKQAKRALKLRWCAAHVPGAAGLCDQLHANAWGTMGLAVAIRDGGAIPPPPPVATVHPSPAWGVVEGSDGGESDVFGPSGYLGRVPIGDPRRARLYALGEWRTAGLIVVPALPELTPRAVEVGSLGDPSPVEVDPVPVPVAVEVPPINGHAGGVTIPGAAEGPTVAPVRAAELEVQPIELPPLVPRREPFAEQRTWPQWDLIELASLDPIARVHAPHSKAAAQFGEVIFPAGLGIDWTAEPAVDGIDEWIEQWGGFRGWGRDHAILAAVHPDWLEPPIEGGEFVTPEPVESAQEVARAEGPMAPPPPPLAEVAPPAKPAEKGTRTDNYDVTRTDGECPHIARLSCAGGIGTARKIAAELLIDTDAWGCHAVAKASRALTPNVAAMGGMRDLRIGETTYSVAIDPKYLGRGPIEMDGESEDPPMLAGGSPQVVTELDVAQEGFSPASKACEPPALAPDGKLLSDWTDADWASWESQRAAEAGQAPVIEATAELEDPKPTVDPGVGKYLVCGPRGAFIYWIEAPNYASARARAEAAATHGPVWAFEEVRAVERGEWATLPSSLTETVWKHVPTEPKTARAIDKPTARKAPDDKHTTNGTAHGPTLTLFGGADPTPPPPKGKAKAAPELPRWTVKAPKLGHAARAVGDSLEVTNWARRVWPDTPIRMEGFDAATWDGLPELTPAGLIGFPAEPAEPEAIAPPVLELVAPAPPAEANPVSVSPVSPVLPVPTAPAPAVARLWWDGVLWNMGRCDVVARIDADSADAAHFAIMGQLSTAIHAPKALLVHPAVPDAALRDGHRWTQEPRMVHSLATAMATRFTTMRWDVFAQADGGDPQLLGRIESEDEAVAVILGEIRHPEYAGEIYARAASAAWDHKLAKLTPGAVEVRNGVMVWGCWAFAPTALDTIPAEDAEVPAEPPPGADAPPAPFVDADGSVPTDTDAQLMAVVKASRKAQHIIVGWEDDDGRATDGEIRGMLGRAFEGRTELSWTDKARAPRTILGGTLVITPDVTCCFTPGDGGDAPKLWASKPTPDGRPTLEGGELIVRTRAAFGIPFPDGRPAPAPRKPGRPSSKETLTTG